MSNIVGNVSKNSTYLAVLTARVELDRAHPLHHGVKMQAHHIISAKGVQLSGMGSKLVELGYNINAAKNLIFLPSTLQGACHLGVQPHRGDHGAMSEPSPEAREGGSYDDDAHPESYHDLIAQMLRRARRSIDRQCDGKESTSSIVQAELDGMSRNIALMIYETPSMARLTRIADSFLLGHSTGCSGADSVGTHNSTKKCLVSRDHFQRQAKHQRSESIKFKSTEPYKPQPGK